jgi:RNA polymerase sigma-54 factor
MALETKLVQKLSQTLLMTPQLQQAIKLLQLGRLEYKEAIEKELLENPILEEVKEGPDATETATFDPPAAETSDPEQAGPLVEDNTPPPPPESGAEDKPAQKTSMEWEDYLESFSDWRGSATPRGTLDSEERPSLEQTLTRSETLEEHMLGQIRMQALDEKDQEIAQMIIGNLDRNGYLCASYEEVAEDAKCTPAEVAAVIEVIKTFDPPGVAARDLRECLLFQLENRGLENALEGRIIRDHLEKLERHKYDQIAKAEGVDLEAISKALATIQTLEPRPGRQLNEDTTRYIVPDIYVYKVGSEYVISLNEDGLPKLRVSPYYLQILKNGDTENMPNKEYLTERLKAASWLIKSIHQRQNTIYRVTESIMKFQREFLDYGIERMKPLVLKDVADDIGMHESTVSRVTTNKYVHTPQGVFELKYFFSTGIKSSVGGSDVSSSAIKEKIRTLIAGETANAPLSDQEIVEILKKETIDIARRTVAKYREALGIESSSRRKKVF